MTASDNQLCREMGIPDASVTALMDLHDIALERLREIHRAEVAVLKGELATARAEVVALKGRTSWAYRMLFGAGLFLAYLVRG